MKQHVQNRLITIQSFKIKEAVKEISKKKESINLPEVEKENFTP